MNMVTFLRKASHPATTAPSPGAESTVSDELLIAQRYGLLLHKSLESQGDERVEASAWKRLEATMALVPGPAADPQDDGGDASPGPIYIDKFAVTNAEFLNFVTGGGYTRMELWPQAIWPNVLQFVDQTGHASPRFWNNGKYARGKDNHPVVGVCWYEARAYALWVGKRLPTGSEWEGASSWCCGADGRKANRYPWGNAFDPQRANTWSSALRGTAAVDAFTSGATPNGIHQLIGNVWEWVSTRFQLASDHEGYHVSFEEDMAEVRGGAFNTYFEEQATSQFRSGQPFLYRGDNVGFRCCLSASDLKNPPQPEAFL